MTCDIEQTDPEPLPIRDRLRSAGTTLTVASASYDIWCRYMNHETRDLDAMNVFPTFFRYDQEAHFRTMIVSLYTLYDTHRGTLTINSLIHELEPDAAKPVRRRYGAVHDAVRKVRRLRHEAIAHRNAALSYDAAFKAAQLTPNDLARLIQDSHELLVLIADALGEPQPVLSPFLAGDNGETARLLSTIKRRAI